MVNNSLAWCHFVKMRKTRNQTISSSVLSVVMIEEVRFLRDAAERLRVIAHLAPEVAPKLQEMASEIDAEADRLEAQGGPS
jgi:hypothetical protein